MRFDNYPIMSVSLASGDSVQFALRVPLYGGLAQINAIRNMYTEVKCNLRPKHVFGSVGIQIGHFHPTAIRL